MIYRNKYHDYMGDFSVIEQVNFKDSGELICGTEWFVFYRGYRVKRFIRLVSIKPRGANL